MKHVTLLSMTAAGLWLGTGCVERRVVYVQEPAGAPVQETVVTEAPPPPQVEVVGVAPGPGYIWLPGAWEWHGRWVWVGGHWVPGPHPHAVWVRGHWVHRHHGWVWIQGYWR